MLLLFFPHIMLRIFVMSICGIVYGIVIKFPTHKSTFQVEITGYYFINCEKISIQYEFEKDIKNKSIIQMKNQNKYYSIWEDNTNKLTFTFETNHFKNKYKFGEIGVDYEVNKKATYGLSKSKYQFRHDISYYIDDKKRNSSFRNIVIHLKEINDDTCTSILKFIQLSFEFLEEYIHDFELDGSYSDTFTVGFYTPESIDKIMHAIKAVVIFASVLIVFTIGFLIFKNRSLLFNPHEQTWQLIYYPNSHE
ncbi:hypothetical protein RF11_05349 [Thelohanellus kitauei]|uniref:Uncharacterized protein n=1 Tax=Thelohanellus kitauei TaxID=669202 RepID=A0A0C2JVR9_THEKT|nr:hypothetical protein RF11_05349 [Thelohanellus kitauei]